MCSYLCVLYVQFQWPYTIISTIQAIFRATVCVNVLTANPFITYGVEPYVTLSNQLEVSITSYDQL